MPARSKSGTISQVKSVKMTDMENGNQADGLSMFPKSFISTKNKTPFIFLVFVLLLAALFFFKRSLFVAATVNGSPISSLDLQIRLNRDYHKQALDQLLNEKLIETEARNNKVIVSGDEINKKLDEYETKYGGSDSFNKLLEQQGTTREALKGLLKTQLSLEKMYGGEVSVSAKEIDDYIKVNKSVLKATEAGAQKTEVEGNIREQKMFQIFTGKFQELKDKAKVTLF